MKATSNYNNIVTYIIFSYSSMILSVYFLNNLNISKSLLIFYTSFSELAANLDDFSIKFMNILLISTYALKVLVVFNNNSLDYK